VEQRRRRVELGLRRADRHRLTRAGACAEHPASEKVARMSRTTVMLLTALAALALTAPGAQARPRHHCPKGKKAVGHRCVTIKKKKPAAKKPPAFAGTPITASLLDGSTATLTIGDTARSAALTGSLKGLIPGGYQLGRDNTILLTAGTLGVGAADLLTDGCPAPAVAAIDPATSVRLDPAKKSSATVFKDGRVTASAAVVVRTVIDQRADGCGGPTAPSGYADTPLTAALHGQIQKETGLARLTLDADPQPATIAVCTAFQAAADPCSSPPLTIPTAIALHVVVAVKIG
jgi:hypothetical protein